MKRQFSNKRKTVNTIIIHKSNRIIEDNKKISYTLNKYIINLTKTLKLKKISRALKRKSPKHLLRHFNNHSTKKNRERFNIKEIFTFHEFKETEIIETMKEL